MIADVMAPDGTWKTKDCAACEHVLNIPTVDFVTVRVCGHPKSGGRFTAWQAREDVLRCGPGGAWYLDRAAMDRACT